jgi:hypothetical protein
MNLFRKIVAGLGKCFGRRENVYTVSDSAWTVSTTGHLSVDNSGNLHVNAASVTLPSTTVEGTLTVEPTASQGDEVVAPGAVSGGAISGTTGTFDGEIAAHAELQRDDDYYLKNLENQAHHVQPAGTRQRSKDWWPRLPETNQPVPLHHLLESMFSGVYWDENTGVLMYRNAGGGVIDDDSVTCESLEINPDTPVAFRGELMRVRRCVGRMRQYVAECSSRDLAAQSKATWDAMFKLMDEVMSNADQLDELTKDFNKNKSVAICEKVLVRKSQRTCRLYRTLS